MNWDLGRFARRAMWSGCALGVIAIALWVRAYVELARSLASKERIEIVKSFGEYMASPQAVEFDDASRTPASKSSHEPISISEGSTETEFTLDEPSEVGDLDSRLETYLNRTDVYPEADRIRARVGRGAPIEIVGLLTISREGLNFTPVEMEIQNTLIEKMTGDPEKFLVPINQAIAALGADPAANHERVQLQTLRESLVVIRSRPGVVPAAAAEQAEPQHGSI